MLKCAHVNPETYALTYAEAKDVGDYMGWTRTDSWLAHANITTTSRYLSTTRTRLQSVSKRFEAHRGAELQGGV